MPGARRVTLWGALEPIDRIAEVLFGLIMALTFTGSLSIAESGREDVKTMLVGALGCNLAWGIIDAVFYLMGRLAEIGSGQLTLRSVQSTRDPATARRLISGAIPEVVAGVLQPDELEDLHQRLRKLPEPPRRPRLSKPDWLAALSVFLLVFLTTFPVAMPFLFLQDFRLAIRLSNGVAIAMLFIAGAAYARLLGRPPWGVALMMVALGSGLVALTMALGG
jgi:hypothetical protein